MTRSAIPAIAALNVAVFLAWHSLGRTDSGLTLMQDHFLVSSASVLSGRVWTLLTSEFSHLDAQHLVFNLLGLWVFGRDVEAVLGVGRFVAMYLVAAVVASLAHVGYDLVIGQPIPALGASGAVMGAAVLYGALYPKRTLMVNFILPVPAAVAVAGYVVLDLIGALGGGGGVAHAAHLGGAAVGFATWLWLRPKLRRSRDPWD